MQKQVKGIKKGKKEKAGSEEASREKNPKLEKWKESGNHNSSEKHLGEKSQISRSCRCLNLNSYLV